MIVNPFSVSALTIDIVSFGLAVVTVVKTVEQLSGRSAQIPKTGEIYTARENQRYLLFWLGVVLLTIRLLSWPFFYLVMQSFVREVTGAMCIYGATKLLPRLTLFLECVKPLLFFLGTIWLILFGLERLSRDRSAMREKAVTTMLVLLLSCAVLALIDAGGSVYLWIRSSAELAVSCCTTITDIPSRFTVWIPEAVLGQTYERPLWYGYFIVNAIMLIMGAVGCLQVLKSKISLLPFLILSCLAFLAGGVTLLAMIELVAPTLMGLSFHHCIYCFVQDVLDGVLILVLVVVGSFSFMALSPVYLLARSWTEKTLLKRVMLLLMSTGMLGLSGSLLMVSVHLLL